MKFVLYFKCFARLHNKKYSDLFGSIYLCSFQTIIFLVVNEPKILFINSKSLELLYMLWGMFRGLSLLPPNLMKVPGSFPFVPPPPA